MFAAFDGQLWMTLLAQVHGNSSRVRWAEKFKSHFELKRLFGRSIYHRAIPWAIPFGNRSTPFLKTTLATTTIMVRHVTIVIWVRHRFQKRIARVLARSLFRRRPYVDTGYPKYGLRADLTDTCDNGTVEGVTMVWSSDRVNVDASLDCCSGYAGSSRFTSDGRVPP